MAKTVLTGLLVDGDLEVSGSVSLGSSGSLPAATAAKAGAVKMAASVAEAAGDNPTAAEFKALLDALKTAGIMESET